MVGVRAAFDAVISRYPQLKTRLGPHGAIINNAVLESGIVKIICRQRLTAAEDAECERFRLSGDDSAHDVNEARASFVAEAFKRRKTDDTCTRFMDVKWVPPTSNVCERFFSVAKLVYTGLRKGLDDDTLDDESLTKIMLTNVIDVFPDISRKFTVDNAQELHTPLLSEAKNTLISPNLCGDISAFEKIEDTPPHALFMANGNEEVVKQKGTVVMLLFNEHSKKMEER
ncbi:hypothetical protein ATCC90586_009810 [Pythium insidiosum]|nr:hypothetical protein ATCC90586_009810 [Pythium insidiosum]